MMKDYNYLKDIRERIKSMFGKKSLAVTILALFWAAYFFSIAATSEPEQFTFPAQIASLKLRHFSHGKEAIVKISRLHSKEIEMKNGHVAHYESDRVRTMLYISEFDSEDQARQQIDLMRKKIEKGSKGFGHFREFEIEERTIYSVLGFGQIHYFYLDSNRVIWLAADPSMAKLVLKAALKVIK